MTHSDDDGLVLPPRIAPAHLVIIPVTPKEDTRAAVLDYCLELKQALEAQNYLDGRVKVEFDDRDIRGGEKTWGWVKREFHFVSKLAHATWRTTPSLSVVVIAHPRISRLLVALSSSRALQTYLKTSKQAYWPEQRPTGRKTQRSSRRRPSLSSSSPRRTKRAQRFTEVSHPLDSAATLSSRTELRRSTK